MRPRPDAAENAQGTFEGDPTYTASMRPRPDAAENAGSDFRTATKTPLQ